MRSKKQLDVVIFRITPGEKKALQNMAERDGLNMTEVVRNMIRDESKRRGLGELGLIELDQLKKGGKS
jgi:hypothetical protein